jgi:hypothetical protein
MKQPIKDFSEAETERRRDEVVRRMANTPPQPKVTPRPKKRKKAAGDRAVRKARVDRER